MGILHRAHACCICFKRDWGTRSTFVSASRSHMFVEIPNTVCDTLKFLDTFKVCYLNLPFTRNGKLRTDYLRARP